MLEKVVILIWLEILVLSVAPIFDLEVDFKVFLSNHYPLIPCLKTVAILTRLQKMVLPIAPLFDLGVDFDVFYAKYGFFGPEFSF